MVFGEWRFLVWREIQIRKKFWTVTGKIQNNICHFDFSHSGFPLLLDKRAGISKKNYVVLYPFLYIPCWLQLWFSNLEHCVMIVRSSVTDRLHDERHIIPISVAFCENENVILDFYNLLPCDLPLCNTKTWRNVPCLKFQMFRSFLTMIKCNMSWLTWLIL